MSAVAYRFLEPLDVLFLRGNKLFGDPGSFGEALIPPWPSVAAGAIRSRMLADAGIDLAAFARGEVQHAELGTPQAPGPFTVIAFHLARRWGKDAVEILRLPPADLIITEDHNGVPGSKALAPTPPAPGLTSSAPLPLLPVLAETERRKPAAGYWLTQSGWAKYLAGHTLTGADLLKSSALWRIDPRVGVGLNPETRSVAEGRLFSVQAVAMQAGVGFLAAVTGAVPPSTGMLRLGGDGRAATIRPATVTLPEPDYLAIVRARRCRLILTTPGLFSSGWLPTGIQQQSDGSHRFALHGVKGRLACSAVPRAEVVSGWDLARWQPKPAEHAAPVGSVYWLDELEATPDALRKLADQGLWGEPCENPQRRAEGFNRFTFALY